MLHVDGEIDQLGPLASFLPHHPSMPREAPQTRPSTAPPQQQQQQPQHHATKHSKAKPNAASEEYTDVHPMRQSHGITDTASFASQVRAQLEKTQSGGDASSPVSKFQAYEDRPVKSLATNMLKKQLEGGNGHGRVAKKGSQPTLRQSSSLPSTPSPRHSSSSLPSTPTPRSPHDFHHTSKAGREKGRSHLGKQRGGGGGGSSGDLRGASSGSKADHGKHGKEAASSRKQGKGQSGRHWEVNGNPDFERYVSKSLFSSVWNMSLPFKFFWAGSMLTL